MLLKPNDRVAIVGKSRSGKTHFATQLALRLMHAMQHYNARKHPPNPWRMVALDTKQSDEDREKFDQIGLSTQDAKFVWRTPNTGIVFRPERKHKGSIKEQSAELFGQVYDRQNACVYIDEFTSVVENARECGEELDDVFVRGGGRNVGIIGLTQEPVNIPRKLISQSTHIFLFDLFHNNDRKVAKELFAGWERPPDPHGFWYLWVDGRGDWEYFADADAFFQRLEQ